MDALLALALSIGILIAGWTYLALGVAALPVWAGIVAWGCFFAAGGKTAGLTKTIASNLSGVLWAFLALYLWNRFGGGVPMLSLLVGIAAFIMVMQAKIPALSFIPGRVPRRGDRGERRGRGERHLYQHGHRARGGRGVRLLVGDARRGDRAQERDRVGRPAQERRSGARGPRIRFYRSPARIPAIRCR